MRSRFVEAVLVFLPVLSGLALSVWRFRSHAPVSGIACVMGGMFLTVLVVMKLPDADAKGRG